MKSSAFTFFICIRHSCLLLDVFISLPSISPYCVLKLRVHAPEPLYLALAVIFTRLDERMAQACTLLSGSSGGSGKNVSRKQVATLTNFMLVLSEGLCAITSFIKIHAGFCRYSGNFLLSFCISLVATSQIYYLNLECRNTTV